MAAKKIANLLKLDRTLPTEGSSYSLEEIYFVHSDKIKKQAYFLVGPDMAHDMTQEVFLKIQKNLHKFNNKSSLETWIYRITLNTCLDFLKKEKRKQLLFFQPAKVSSTPAQDNSVKQLIVLGIEKLSNKQKECFVLFYISELTLKEISELLHLSEGTVKSRLHKSRLIMQKHLKSNGVNYE